MAGDSEVSGEVIAGRYRLLSPLGRGGMGTVWRALHLALNSEVAVKLVDPQIARDETGRLRFQREAQAAAGIRSPHVVQILDHGVDDDTPYIVMELLEGESLAQRLEQRKRLSLEETSRIITHVARAMARAHEAGVVHRDLKPDNVFLVQNDDEEIAKVLDFGIAKAETGLADNTRTGAIMGTPHYMSPEQLRGEKSLDYRADLWAMGVIAFECVCGGQPFVSETFPDLVIKICSEPPRRPSSLAQVPPGFDAWFERAVQRAPEQRFQSAKELAQALRQIALPDDLRVSAASGFPAVDALGGPSAAQPAALAVSAPAFESASATAQGALSGGTHHATANTQDGLPRPASRVSRLLLALAALVGLGAVLALTLSSQRAAVEPEPAVSAAPAVVSEGLDAAATEVAPPAPSTSVQAADSAGEPEVAPAPEAPIAPALPTKIGRAALPRVPSKPKASSASAKQPPPAASTKPAPPKPPPAAGVDLGI